MSKGPGRTQRTILDAVDRHGEVYLASLAQDVGSKYKSLYRAACRLADAGRIGMTVFRYGAQKVLLHRPGKPQLRKTKQPWNGSEVYEVKLLHWTLRGMVKDGQPTCWL